MKRKEDRVENIRGGFGEDLGPIELAVRIIPLMTKGTLTIHGILDWKNSKMRQKATRTKDTIPVSVGTTTVLSAWV